MTYFNRSMIYLLLSAIFLYCIYPHFGWDERVMTWYTAPSGAGFPLKGDFVLNGIFHDGVKKVVWVIPFAVLVLWVSSFKKASLTLHRRCLGWLFFGLLMPPLVVTVLKSHNTEICPWSLAVYGGQIQKIPEFSWLWSSRLAGHCFPGGHAATGFSLLAFYFAWRDDHVRAARWALLISLLVGAGLGWVQVMRGAHFVSHNLWTAWVIWALLLLFYRIYPPVKQ